MGRRCDCENSTCHPKADCVAEGTVKTIHSTVCEECAAKMPAEYLASTTKCAFCPNPAEFNWSDADGNESKPVCQNCLEASDRPRWQFTRIATDRENGDPCPHGNQVRTAQGQLVPCGSAGYNDDENLIVCGECAGDDPDPLNTRGVNSGVAE